MVDVSRTGDRRVAGLLRVLLSPDAIRLATCQGDAFAVARLAGIQGAKRTRR